MSRINPGECEYAKTQRNPRISYLQVIEYFAKRKENVTDIMGPEYRDTNPSEVEAIGEEDEGDSGEMMNYKFQKIFSWLFKL